MPAINGQKHPWVLFQRLFHLLDTIANAVRIHGNSGLEENWEQSYLAALTYLDDIIEINKKFPFQLVL